MRTETEAAATELFEAHRPRLVRLAYRMLGSVDEAEDIAQEAWLRWQRDARDDVREPGAFLTRTVTRLCLDTMKSARVRRETYVGNWLPEPIAEPQTPDFGDDPGDDLTMTLMLALERLSPLERAAFLLHDVFGIPLQEVAGTLNREAGTVRQLAARARQHLQAARPRFPVERNEGEALAQAFFTASRSGDVDALRTLLAEKVVLQSDGGGKVKAFLNPIVGQERLLRLYRGLAKKHTDVPPLLVQSLWIDGLPGFISRERGILQSTALAVEDGRIVAIYVTRNPDKLNRIARVLPPRFPAT